MEKIIIVSIILGVFSMVFLKDSRVRGLRNFNPFNLIKSNDVFEGEIVPSQDDHFKQFKSMEFGIRAGMITLRNGYFRKGLTVSQIINKYAPSFENNTDAYINSVCKQTGLTPHQIPSIEHYTPLAKAIINHENGANEITIELINNVNKSYSIWS